MCYTQYIHQATDRHRLKAMSPDPPLLLVLSRSLRSLRSQTLPYIPQKQTAGSKGQFRLLRYSQLVCILCSKNRMCTHSTSWRWYHITVLMCAASLSEGAEYTDTPPVLLHPGESGIPPHCTPWHYHTVG